MERLTFDGNFCDIAQCRELPCKYDNNCMQKQVWEKLKKYEDIGLSPEGVKNARDYALGRTLVEVSEYDVFPAWRLREFTTAEREGRLLILPCKVGDKLYRVFDGNISEHEVQNMRYFARQGRLGIDMTPFFPDAERFIGKTVFLTREEAEKALEARNGNQ